MQLVLFIVYLFIALVLSWTQFAYFCKRFKSYLQYNDKMQNLEVGTTDVPAAQTLKTAVWLHILVSV